MMHTNRRFVFTHVDDESKQKQLEVNIPEIMDPNYGMYVWPAAPVLAQYVWYNQQNFMEKNVLEIGAGTSLAGVVAALCGAHVTISDSSYFPNSIQNAHKSCEANNITNYDVLGLTWGKISSTLRTMHPMDFVIASDCFYDPQDFEDIIVTVAFLLNKNPQAKFIFSYQIRSANWNIADLLLKWKCQSIYVPLADFEADTSDIAGSGLPGSSTIELYEITKTC